MAVSIPMIRPGLRPAAAGQPLRCSRAYLFGAAHAIDGVTRGKPVRIRRGPATVTAARTLREPGTPAVLSSARGVDPEEGATMRMPAVPAPVSAGSPA